MGFSLKQSSLAGGIISPQLLGRSDQVKYAAGLAVCQNAWITRYGTFENRPGTQFCGEVKDSSNPLRIIPFIFSQSQSYLLEVGNDYFRPWLGGAHVQPGAGGTPALSWSDATTYAQGDFATLVIGGIGHVYRSLQSGNLNHSPDVSPTWWMDQPASGGITEVTTVIPQASLSALQYVQQNDIMTLAQQGIVPQQFLRFSDSKWQQQAFALYEGIAAPTGGTATAGRPSSSAPGNPTSPAAVGGNAALPPDYYVITSTSFLGNESAASDVAQSTVGGADAGNPVALSWTASSGSGASAAVHYNIYKLIGGQYLLIGHTSGNPPPTNFSDNGLSAIVPNVVAPTTPANVFVFRYAVTAISDTNGAESLASSSFTCTGFAPTDSAPNLLTWPAVSGATKYNVYRSFNGVNAFIGQSSGSGTIAFSDNGIIPDTSQQPPIRMTLFATSKDYPAVVGCYQERLAFADTLNEPQSVELSRIGVATNFTTRTPVGDDDAVKFTIASKQVQPIRALIDLGKLIVHTDSAEYVGQGNAAGAITPSSVGLVNQGAGGCHTVPPVTIGNTDLYVQAGGTRVLDLRYEVQSFGFTGKDLTKFAPDLFKGRTIVDAAWQKLPHSIVWYVLDNGTVVGLTYTRDGSQDDVIAWHSHAFTNGAVENVAVVPEGTQFATYFVIRRTINGATKRYIERLAPRDCIDTVLFSDSYFCDCSLTFDGRVTDGTAIVATTSGGWTTQDTLTLTISGMVTFGGFVSGDVGNAIVLQQKDPLTGLVTDQVTIDITGYTSSTVVTGTPRRTVPTWAQASLTTWGRAVKSFSGIGHLEGQAISVFADGNVIADPLDSSYATITVASGAFTIPTPALVVTAGLPIDMRGQTLPLENAQGETVMNKTMAVREVCPMFYNSRGGWFGQDFAHLKQWKQPESPTMGFPVPATTGPVRIPVQGSPQKTGQVCWRLTNPTPFSLSALVISGEAGA